MSDIPFLQLFINHVEVAQVDWNMSTEEVLGGTGQHTLSVQDRTNSWEPQAHWDVQAKIRSSGWVLFRGEIIDDGIELEIQHPFRTWKLTCSDYNPELQQRKVGALDGKTWIDSYGLGFFVNIDPFASSLETDKLTVQQLFDHYVRVDGQSIETATFVGEYLTDFFPIRWDRKDVQAALEEMAALVIQNLQFWIDPDLFFHWVTIPAWQDLAASSDATYSGIPGDPDSVMNLMLPEAVSSLLPEAPAEVSDVDLSQIGFSRLGFTLDGKDMPEQVYVNGSTGYVYNAPPISPADETKVVVRPPTTGGAATYKLEFLATTKLWHTDSTGYISLSYDTVGASGPYTVKWVRIPWNEARHKGGNFWKLLNGPNAGKLVDNDTNVLAGYGEIRVTRYPVTSTGDPKIGIGGSGWVGEVTQDPNKRQAYLDAPVSDSQAKRDSLGGQAVYRGSTPTLRGHVTVRGIDGWRVGQLLRIHDERLPTYLNHRQFVIQRVATKLIPENDIREYNIDWGDGPTSRYSAQRGPGDVNWPPPAIQIVVAAHDLTPGPNSTQIITGQLVNGLGEPWAVAGKVVEWSFECYNNLGVLQTGQGSIAPEVSVTDDHGKARTKLTTGPGTNLVYFVFADVKVT